MTEEATKKQRNSHQPKTYSSTTTQMVNSTHVFSSPAMWALDIADKFCMAHCQSAC